MSIDKVWIIDTDDWPDSIYQVFAAASEADARAIVAKYRERHPMKPGPFGPAGRMPDGGLTVGVALEVVGPDSPAFMGWLDARFGSNDEQ